MQMTTMQSSPSTSMQPTQDNSASTDAMRLNKFLARAGVASRRASEELIAGGHVCVNGEVRSDLGCKVVCGKDEVCVDGVPVVLEAAKVYLMLHKPAGYITSMTDPHGRPCVSELVPCEQFPGLFYVGRLDQDTTGLLLFTTDGELGQKLLHPKFHVEKTYEACVDGCVRDAELQPLREGITLDDGPCKPAKVQLESAGTTSQVRISISEGRKRQVKRMFSAIHHPVLKLHRSSFGSVQLGDLAEGEWRHLTNEEVSALKRV